MFCNPEFPFHGMWNRAIGPRRKDLFWLCWLRDFSKPVNEGHAFLVFDISKMMPVDDFKKRMDKMIQQIHNAPKAKEADKIYLPGEMEWDNYYRQLKDGIDLPDFAAQSLNDLAQDLNMDWSQYTVGGINA